jgi:hypothetical protein
MKKQSSMMLLALTLTLATQAAVASDVTGLASFTAGTPARAADVNGNFTAVKTAVDDNQAQITALETAITTLETANTALTASIAALEAKLASMSVTTSNGQPTVRFTGVNLQVVNGLAATATANGTGNLIVGYDEADASGFGRCTLGTNPYLTGLAANVTDSTTCAAAGGTWVTTGFKTGSHYVVAGSGHNYSRWGGLLAGWQNTSNYNYASVIGGYNNTASGSVSTVSGGHHNVAGGDGASVSGGWANTASGAVASVSGGARNTASGDQSSVSGGGNTVVVGYGNVASGMLSSISGGWGNAASGSFSSISGGGANTASGTAASISGGGNGGVGGGNVADTDYSSILGGALQNTSATWQTIPALP